MARSTIVMFAVAAMLATTLFANPALAECNKRGVLSDANAQTVLVTVAKKGDFCTPYLTNKAAVDKALADAGCTPADFKADFSSCTKPPAPADKGEVAKTKSPAPVADKGKVAEKAKPADDSERQPVLVDFSTCHPRSADIVLGQKATLREQFNRNNVLKIVKEERLSNNEWWGRYAGPNGSNTKAFGQYRRIGDPTELGPSVAAHMSKFYNRPSADAAWADPTGRSKAMAKAAISLRDSIPEKDRSEKLTFLCEDLSELNDPLALEMASCACFSALPEELKSFSVAGDERDHRPRLTKWADLKKDMPVEAVSRDGSFFGTVSDLSEKQAVVEVAKGVTRAIPFDNFQKGEVKLYVAESFCENNECPDCPECPECSGETRLSKFNYGHVGSPTVSAWFTSNSKPLLPGYMNLYAGFVWSGFNGSSSQSFRGIEASVDHEGWTGGGIVGLDFEWNIINYLTLFSGFHMELAHQETIVYDSRADGRSVDTSLVFQAGGRVGVNFAGWVSAYMRAYGQPNPDGWGLVGGLELTGLDAMFIGIEGGKHFSLDNATSAFTSGDPVNPDGPMVRVLMGLRF